MITAKIIAKSYNPYTHKTITTWELEYPRVIHAEFMTHRVFSRNSASSRAIPVPSMLANIRENPVDFVHWGKNQAGMQAKEELTGADLEAAKHVWLRAMEMACHQAEQMHNLGAHKQIVNRITEPYQHMKVVMTTTERNNWYWLRNHPDADPSIHRLAEIMQAIDKATDAVGMTNGMWHLPYVKVLYRFAPALLYEFPVSKHDEQVYFDETGKQITLQEALMISASCCAQVSYRKSDGSLEKAETIFRRLIESEPCHASPVEHQAKCFDGSRVGDYSMTWPEGITHMNRNGEFCSGNFTGWIQHRQLIPNNAKEG